MSHQDHIQSGILSLFHSLWDKSIVVVPSKYWIDYLSEKISWFLCSFGSLWEKSATVPCRVQNQDSYCCHHGMLYVIGWLNWWSSTSRGWALELQGRVCWLRLHRTTALPGLEDLDVCCRLAGRVSWPVREQVTVGRSAAVLRPWPSTCCLQN